MKRYGYHPDQQPQDNSTAFAIGDRVQIKHNVLGQITATIVDGPRTTHCLQWKLDFGPGHPVWLDWYGEYRLTK